MTEGQEAQAQEEAQAQQEEAQAQGEAQAQAQAQEQAQAQQEDAEPKHAERPEWLPEKFWDEKKGEPNYENLAKSYRELEKTRVNEEELREKIISELREGVPESPDGYELPDNELLDKEELAQSPVVNLFRQVAQKSGIKQEQFAEVINEYAKVEAERIENFYKAEMAKLGDNAKARAQAVGTWAQKTFANSPEKLAAIEQITTTAAGIELIEELMGKGNTTIPTDTTPIEDATEEEIRKLMNSPAYWDRNRQDPQVVEKVTKFFERKYGGRQA